MRDSKLIETAIVGKAVSGSLHFYTNKGNNKAPMYVWGLYWMAGQLFCCFHATDSHPHLRIRDFHSFVRLMAMVLLFAFVFDHLAFYFVSQ